jgi:LacI family transcriptional regulator
MATIRQASFGLKAGESMPTVQDVAQRAGVSTATVSYVLNGTRFVSDALRERVLAVVRELRYEPNAIARTLRSNRSDTLGLILPDLRNPFFTEVVRGVEEVAQARGYTVLLANSDEDPEREAKYVRVMRAKHVDGLIIAPAGGAYEELEQLVQSHFPVVLLDRDVAGLGASAVMLDNEAAAHAAVEHLIGLGHRRVGMITGRPPISSTIERERGYRRALREAGLPFDEHLVLTGESTTEGGAAAASTLLERPSPPSALFAANNLMTIGALMAIERHGLSIPGDIALVGFDEIPWADVFRPRLTTVEQPLYELGRMAAELVLKQRSAGDHYPERVLLPGTLIVRDSTGAPEWLRAPIPLSRRPRARQAPRARPRRRTA